MRSALGFVVLWAGMVACGGPAAHRNGGVDDAASSASAEASDSLPDVVASWEGGQITGAELAEAVQAEASDLLIEYRTNLHDLRRQRLDQLVDEALLEGEATRSGEGTVDDLLRKRLQEELPAPSDEAVQAEFDKVKDRLPPEMTLDMARPMIEAELQRNAAREAFRELIEGLREDAKLSTDLPYPDLPRVDVKEGEAVAKGPKNAPITIVEFAEYQCPYCGMAAPTVERLLETYEGKVRFVFMDYPLPGHDRAVPAANAAHCAGEQDAYWSFHDKLMADQSKVDDAGLKNVAAELGIDVAKWEACVADARYVSRVEANASAGRDVGVQATPTFFINGLKLSGAQPFERFAEIIDAELAAN